MKLRLPLLTRFGLLLTGLALPRLTHAQAPAWRSVVGVQPDTTSSPYLIERTLALPNGDALVTGAQYYAPPAPVPIVDDQYHVVCLTPTGRVRWGLQDYSDNDPQGNSSGYTIIHNQISTTPAGHVMVAGFLFGNQPVPFGTADTLVNQNPTTDWNQNNGFVGELDGRTGTWRWAEPVTGTVIGLAVDQPTGDVMVAFYPDNTRRLGRFTLDSTTSLAVARLHNRQWQWVNEVRNRIQGLNSLTMDPLGRVTLTGVLEPGYPAQFGPATITPGRGYSFVAQLTPTGTWRWVQALRGAAVSGGIAADAAGNVWMAGSCSDTLLVGNAPLQVATGGAGFLAQFEPNGNVRQVVTMPVDTVGGQDSWPFSYVWPQAIRVAPDGGVLVGGDFYGRLTLGSRVVSSTRSATSGPGSPGTSDVFVARYDSTGWAWTTTVAGATDKQFKGMDLTPNGQLLVAGRAADRDTLSFGTDLRWLPNRWSFLATLDLQAPLGVAPPATAYSLALWPNPAATVAHLTLPTPANSATEVLLTDALGRTVRTDALPAGTTRLDLPLRGLPAGLYLVRAGQHTARLVVNE